MKEQLIKVKSPANIAFIKYWGQTDSENVLPANDSFSMNLSGCYTELEMELVVDINVKELYIKDYKAEDYKKNEGDALQKVVTFYDRAAEYLQVKTDVGFRVKAANSFPKKAGIASSASFFSALAAAFSTAFEKKLETKQLSVLARLSGSGSASRSVPDGYVFWHRGISSESSFAESIAPPDYWDIVDLVALVTLDEKKVSSVDGHRCAQTSPYFADRQRQLAKRTPLIVNKFRKKDFEGFGTMVEEEAVSLHSIMMTQKPPLYYWSGMTLDVMRETATLRKKGIEAYCTTDAGENVHIITRRIYEEKVKDHFKNMNFVKEILTNYPCEGVRVL